MEILVIVLFFHYGYCSGTPPTKNGKVQVQVKGKYFSLYLYDLKCVVYCQNFYLPCNVVSHLLKCSVCVILFIVPLFVVLMFA